jgi:type I restriction enzyme M protein
VEPDKTECTSIEFFKSPFAEKGCVSRGDVLLNSTGMGTLGRASFYDSDAPAVADNHVAIMRPDAKICLPVYLSLFLNSPAGLAQSEMFQTGSSGQLEIYPQHIRAMLVYLPKNKTGKIDLAWQEKLADKVLAAAHTKTEARTKLDEAKLLVEQAIEEG